MAQPKRTLRFITGNPGKAAELGALLGPHGWSVEAFPAGYPEIQADTLAEVAEAGAKFLLDAGIEPPFVLEDAGLFIGALKGFPGVYSRNALDTIGPAGILRLMDEVELESRGASFEACIAYVGADGAVHLFSGRCTGTIAMRAAGTNGFGFDSIFIPKGHERTFAEMGPEEKDALSHRGAAANLLMDALKQSAKR